MLDVVPFQPQGIPTLTMYERPMDVGFLRETGLRSKPALLAVNIVIGPTPIDRSVSDGPVNSGPALAALVVMPAPYLFQIAEYPPATLVSWNYHGPNPGQWDIWVSIDNNFFYFNSVAGTDRTELFDLSPYTQVYIIGTTSGLPYTPPSNTLGVA